MGQGMFEGRNAFVTGAANGIGRGIALRLASEGAALALNDIDPAALDAVVARDSRWREATPSPIRPVTCPPQPRSRGRDRRGD